MGWRRQAVGAHRPGEPKGGEGTKSIGRPSRCEEIAGEASEYDHVGWKRSRVGAHHPDKSKGHGRAKTIERHRGDGGIAGNENGRAIGGPRTPGAEDQTSQRKPGDVAASPAEKNVHLHPLEDKFCPAN